MKQRKGFVWVAGVLLSLALVGCDETIENVSGAQTQAVVRDSVVIRDSVRFADSIRVVDSIRFVDSVCLVDSVRIVDSVRVVDSINVVDSVRVIDSVNVVDSVRLVDSVRFVDSVRLVDSIRIVDSVRVIDSVNIVDSIRLVDSLNVIVRYVDSVNIIDSVVVRDSVRIIDSLVLVDSVIVKDSVAAQEPRDSLELRVNENARYIEQSKVKDFTPIATVVENLGENERLLIMVRHAERGSDGSGTTPLNENGIRQAYALGESLKGEDDFYYAASTSIRAHQTCHNIAKGRGEADTLADTLSVLGGTWFVKDTAAYNSAKKSNSGGWNVTSKWAYDNSFSEAFYDLASRSTELLDGYALPLFERSGKRIGVFASHDYVILPLVVYISERNIDLKYYKSSSKRWLNYLAGLAVVLRPDGTRVFYAVKGLESGTMK